MHCELAAEVEPQFSNLHFNLGLVHAMNNDYTAALAALNKYKELALTDEGTKADELLANLKRSVTGTS